MSLLLVAALFQRFDGLQGVATGVLRGFGDTRTPMLWNGAGHWLVGLPAGYVLGFEVAVVALDTGEQQSLVQGAAGTVTASGHLVFAREASLWAVPFDADRLTVSGEPIPIVEGVHVNTGGWAHYAVADDGTLVYLPSVGVAGIDQRGPSGLTA